MHEPGKKILSAEGTLREVFAGLLEHTRWNKTRSPKERKESVAEHMFKMDQYTLLMCILEQRLNNPHGLDFFKILACSVSHDIGEWRYGDTSVMTKTDEEEAKEIQVHTKVFDTIIPKFIRGQFPLPLNNNPQADIRNQEYWRAVEIVGYCLYALEQIRLGHTHNKFVFEDHGNELTMLAEIFPSVKMMRDIFYEQLEELLG